MAETRRVKVEDKGRGTTVAIRRTARSWPRKAVDIPVKLEILTLDGRRFTTGTAIIRDVSLKGARLGSMAVKNGVLPAVPFRIRLSCVDSRHEGIGASCRPVRFGRGPEFELGVAFEDVWAGASGK